MGLEEKIPDGIILATAEKVVNWARKRSTWPFGFGLACCAIEMMSSPSAPSMIFPVLAWKLCAPRHGRRI